MLVSGVWVELWSPEILAGIVQKFWRVVWLLGRVRPGATLVECVVVKDMGIVALDQRRAEAQGGQEWVSGFQDRSSVWVTEAVSTFLVLQEGPPREMCWPRSRMRSSRASASCGS